MRGRENGWEEKRPGERGEGHGGVAGGGGGGKEKRRGFRAFVMENGGKY